MRRADGCVKVTSTYLGIVSRLPGFLKTLTASKFCSWHRVVGPGGACVGAAIQIPSPQSASNARRVRLYCAVTDATALLAQQPGPWLSKRRGAPLSACAPAMIPALKEAQSRVINSTELNMMRMMRMNMVLAVALGLATWATSTVVWSTEQEDQALIKALNGAKVTLQQGLTASQREGQPISAKFELEDGKLQLSIYAAKDGKFSEVIVDYRTGKVAKSEAITGSDDLTHARAQSAAMAKAKTSLKDAVDKAVRGEAGSRAVAVTPDIKDGHAVASIVLRKGQQLKTVEQPLD